MFFGDMKIIFWILAITHFVLELQCAPSGNDRDEHNPIPFNAEEYLKMVIWNFNTIVQENRYLYDPYRLKEIQLAFPVKNINVTVFASDIRLYKGDDEIRYKLRDHQENDITFSIIFPRLVLKSHGKIHVDVDTSISDADIHVFVSEAVFAAKIIDLNEDREPSISWLKYSHTMEIKHYTYYSKNFKKKIQENIELELENMVLGILKIELAQESLTILKKSLAPMTFNAEVYISTLVECFRTIVGSEKYDPYHLEEFNKFELSFSVEGVDVKFLAFNVKIGGLSDIQYNIFKHQRDNPEEITVDFIFPDQVFVSRNEIHLGGSISQVHLPIFLWIVFRAKITYFEDDRKPFLSSFDVHDIGNITLQRYNWPNNLDNIRGPIENQVILKVKNIFEKEFHAAVLKIFNRCMGGYINTSSTVLSSMQSESPTSSVVESTTTSTIFPPSPTTETTNSSSISTSTLSSVTEPMRFNAEEYFKKVVSNFTTIVRESKYDPYNLSDFQSSLLDGDFSIIASDVRMHGLEKITFNIAQQLNIQNRITVDFHMNDLRLTAQYKIIANSRNDPFKIDFITFRAKCNFSMDRNELTISQFDVDKIGNIEIENLKTGDSMGQLLLHIIPNMKEILKTEFRQAILDILTTSLGDFIKTSSASPTSSTVESTTTSTTTPTSSTMESTTTSTTSPTSPTMEVITDKPEFTCPEKAGNFPHPLHEDRFIYCENGYARVVYCDGDGIYNPELKICLTPDYDP